VADKFCFYDVTKISPVLLRAGLIAIFNRIEQSEVCLHLINSKCNIVVPSVRRVIG